MSELTITEVMTLDAVDEDFPVLLDAQPTTLILACPDARLQLALRGLIERKLKLQPGEYVHIADLGGILPLTEVRKPHAVRHMEETIGVALREMPSIDTVAVVKDVLCKKYEYFHREFGDAFLSQYGCHDLGARQEHDIRLAKARVQKLSPRKVNVLQCYQEWANPEQNRVRYRIVN